MSDLNFLSATAMAEQIRLRQISPVELVDAHFARIERVNPKLNAFVHVAAESARAEAWAAEQAVSTGDSVGPLHGVPISIKSSIEVTGMPFEAGSKLRAGVRGKEDAVLVSRLRKAGAIVLGVTNTPELLMAWESDNLLYGRVLRGGRVLVKRRRSRPVARRPGWVATAEDRSASQHISAASAD
jgi:Asp-tRNA(Asn)/Glu-tRNA(Gln) amidotransferase A subunit family amidase